ncbi:MetS family NSS transporter small subunit [Spiroplasma sp. AdecLV25b]|nr:MetS family NSS transporter small subunit [Spiroplasma sp. AdecLV25b]
MDIGAIILMVVSLIAIIGGFIFFIIMDFKNHDKAKKAENDNE